MNSFLDFLEDDQQGKLILQTLLKTSSVLKGTILQRKGDADNKIFFVKKGCLRSFTIDSKGKEHVFMFAPEGWIVADIQSEIGNTPAALYIDALENSEVEMYSRSAFQKTLMTEKIIEKIGTRVLLKRISVLQKRILMLMSASALERYEDFIDTYPTILQRVPQKMIASYLGITPQALSTLRKHRTKIKTSIPKLM